jgi:hypothetical protein
MKRLISLLCLSLIFAAGCGPAGPTPIPTPTTASTPVPGVLYVDPGTDLGPISPYIFGTNYGPMQAVPMDMMPLVLNAGFTALRWPGGAWGDSADMQPFQVDQFVLFYKQLGALPTISVRLLGGTPEKAAELVRYTNIEKQYGVVYWSIGNEPTLYESQTHEPYDTVTFDQQWRAIAEAMKAVDPTIKLMGPELHQWGVNLASTLKDSSGRDWMTEFLKANGDLVDVVTVHRYPLYKPAGQVVTVDDLRNNTAEWPQLITYLRSLIHDITGRDIPIAITEVNSSPTSAFGGAATPDTIYNAIWYADVLGRLIQQHVFMVNQWVISQRSGGLGLIHGSDARPSLYVFYLYKNFGSEEIYASSDVADVTVYAARRSDGTLTILVINMADIALQVPLQVEGGTPTQAEVWLLDAAHNAEDLGPQAIPASGILSLPAQSATLYVIAP